MKGLELARRYWEELGRPAFEKDCPRVLERACVGLVGEGSECFGFDDEISQDHDWGPGFCVWLTSEDMERYGDSARRIYASLPEEFMGYKRLVLNDQTGGRVGVMPATAFYARYTGLDRLPRTVFEWRCIPENGLAVVTNGELFVENTGAFTEIRSGLLDFYPEDLRKKKLAMHCAFAAQSGQYNYARCAHRGEPVAAFLASAEFIGHIQAIVFLLNKRYRPYYKWTHRAMKDLPVLGAELAKKTEALTGPAEYHEKIDIIEDMCDKIIKELRAEGLSSSRSDFLLQHGEEVQRRIEDPQLRDMHLMAE